MPRLVQCQTNWQPPARYLRPMASCQCRFGIMRFCIIVAAWLLLLSFPAPPLPAGSSFVGSNGEQAGALGRAYRRIPIALLCGDSRRVSSSSTGWGDTKSASLDGASSRLQRKDEGDKLAQAQLPTRVNDTFVETRAGELAARAVAAERILESISCSSTTTTTTTSVATVATERAIGIQLDEGEHAIGELSEKRRIAHEARTQRCRTLSECAKVARSRGGNPRAGRCRCCCACSHSDGTKRGGNALNPLESSAPSSAQDTRPGAVRLASPPDKRHETKSPNCRRCRSSHECDLFTCDSAQTKAKAAPTTTTITTFTIGPTAGVPSELQVPGAKLASDQKLTSTRKLSGRERRRRRRRHKRETQSFKATSTRNFKADARAPVVAAAAASETSARRGRVAPDHARRAPTLELQEEDEQTREQLVELLAQFYAHTRRALDRYERLLDHWARLSGSGSNSSQLFKGPNIQVESANQPEVASEQQINNSNESKQSPHNKVQATVTSQLVKMLAGADEESLERWLHLRQLEYARLKNMSIELVSERPNGTIHVCADGPKILLLPNVSDLLYCYTRDQWIARMWSDSLRMSSFHYPIILLNILIFLFGTTGNIFVCLSVKRNHQLRSVTNYFIVNLAFADFLVILICLPATVVWDLTLTWFFGTIPCKLIMFLQDVSISVSVLTLTAISIDRYYAICHPLKFKTSLNQAKHMIALIWLVSLLIMAPDLVYLSAKPSADLAEAGLETVLYNDCNYDWSDDASRAFQFVKTVLLYLVPFLLMFCAHYRIAQVLRMASSMMMAMSDGSGGGAGFGGSENGHAHTEQTALELEQAQPPSAATQTAPPRVPTARESSDATPTQSRDTPPDASTPDSNQVNGCARDQHHHHHRRHHRKCRSHHLSRTGGDGHHHHSRKHHGHHHHHNHHHHHHKHRCKRAPELTSCSATSSSSTPNQEQQQQQQVVVVVADRQQVALGAAPKLNGISEKSNRRLRFAGALSEHARDECRLASEKRFEPPPVNHVVKPARRLLPNRGLLTNGLTSGGGGGGGGDKQSRDYLKKQRIIADLLLKRESSFDWGPASGECGPTKGSNNLTSSPTLVKSQGIFQNNNNNNKPRRQLRKSSCSLDAIKTTTTATVDHNNTGGSKPSVDSGRATSESVVVAAKRASDDLQPPPPVKPPARSLSISAATAAAVASARQKINQEQKQQQQQPRAQQQQRRQRGASTYTHCDSNSANAFILTMHNKSKLESRKRAAKMLTAIVILFGICYLPVHLINFLRQFIDDIPQTDVTSTISMLAHCVCYLNSAINPFIYNHMNSVFRAEFKKFLSCLDWRQRSKRQQQQQQATKLKPALKTSQHAAMPAPGPHDHFQLAPLLTAAHKSHPVARAQMSHEINNNNNNNKDERAKAAHELVTNMTPPDPSQSSGAPPPCSTQNGHIHLPTKTRTTTSANTKATTTTTTTASKAIIAIDDDHDADDDTDAGPAPPATGASLAAAAAAIVVVVS